MGDSDALAHVPDPLSVFRDERGALTLTDLEALPFVPARAYVLHDIPLGAHRGGHAHRLQHRFIVVVSGRVRVLRTDGQRNERLELGPGESVHISPGVWQELEALERGVVVLAFASGPHDPADYVYDRDELALLTAEHTASA
jgi:dTDP-4-dehydrorhamnose 3,5-epimerase-like enzyme